MAMTAAAVLGAEAAAATATGCPVESPTPCHTLRSPSGAGAVLLEPATAGSSAPLDGAAARRWPSQRFHHRRKASRPGADRHSAAAGGGSRRQAPPLAGLLSRADRSAGHTGPEAARATRSRFPARSHSAADREPGAGSRGDSVGLKPCRCCRVAHTDTHTAGISAGAGPMRRSRTVSFHNRFSGNPARTVDRGEGGRVCSENLRRYLSRCVMTLSASRRRMRQSATDGDSSVQACRYAPITVTPPAVVWYHGDNPPSLPGRARYGLARQLAACCTTAGSLRLVKESHCLPCRSDGDDENCKVFTICRLSPACPEVKMVQQAVCQHKTGQSPTDIGHRHMRPSGRLAD